MTTGLSWQIVSAMVSHDLMNLVNTRSLKSWKETLALLCTVSEFFNVELHRNFNLIN